MAALRFVGSDGDFVLAEAAASGLYFPLANEGGLISSVTPTLGGDCKTGQNTFLLAPCSAETLHESRASRNFWLQCADGTLWSAAGQSAAQQAARFGKNADAVTVHGGLLWQTVTRGNAALGVQAACTSFVPAGQSTVELLRVTITNTAAAPLAFTPTAAIPLYGRSADNLRDHRQVTSLLQRLTVQNGGVALRQTLTFDERGHKPGTVCYTVCGRTQGGATPVRYLGPVQDFCGTGSYDAPAALADPAAKTPWLAEGDTAAGYEMTAVLQFAPVVLEAGAAQSWYLALGIDCAGVEYLAPAAFEAALAQTKAWWQAQRPAAFAGGDPDLSGWMAWVGIQPVLRRICGCSFLPHHDYGRGGRGWRDLWQDSLALLLTDPAAVRGDLVRYFAGVRADGTNATIIGRAAGEFLADRNHIVRVWMDHGYWPLLTVDLYIQQTGDLDILLEQQPYFCDDRKHRGELLLPPDAAPASTALQSGGATVTGTVLEHLLIETVTAFFDAGAHGSIRLRGADWNDALDMAAQNGESVAFTAAYAGNLHTLAELCRALAAAGHTTLLLDTAVAELLLREPAAWQTPLRRTAAREAFEAACEQRNAPPRAVDALHAAAALEGMSLFLKDHLRKSEFVTDGANQSWMNSYYDNAGARVEGADPESGAVRMMLTGQVFALLGGVADAAQTTAIARAADWYLDAPLRGGYCLNTDFGTPAPPLGRQFGFAYGHKENGAVFCHMAVMYAFALYSRCRAAQGYKVLEELYRQSLAFESAQIYPGIPEYFDPRGRGMYPYLTGAASWLVYCLLCQSYGVRGRYGDLLLAPQLLPEQFDAQGMAEVELRFAGRAITLRYHNPEELAPGQYTAVCARLGSGECYTAAGGALCIPRGALCGGGTLTIDVELA